MAGQGRLDLRCSHKWTCAGEAHWRACRSASPNPVQLNLTAYTTETGIWAFDHSHQNIVAEALCSSTEDVIELDYSQHTDRSPQSGDRLKLRLDTEPMEPCTTRVERLRFDEAGSTYGLIRANHHGENHGAVQG